MDAELERRLPSAMTGPGGEDPVSPPMDETRLGYEFDGHQLDPEFLIELSDEGHFVAFAFLDLAAGEFPEPRAFAFHRPTAEKDAALLDDDRRHRAV